MVHVTEMVTGITQRFFYFENYIRIADRHKELMIVLADNVLTFEILAGNKVHAARLPF